MGNTPENFINKFNNNEFNFEIEASYDVRKPAKITFQPQSDIETYNSQIFANAIMDTLAHFKQLKEVIIDMEKVSYVSSTGIGSLIQILTYVKKNNLHLSVCNTQPAIQATIDLLGFTIYSQPQQPKPNGE